MLLLWEWSFHVFLPIFGNKNQFCGEILTCLAIVSSKITQSFYARIGRAGPRLEDLAEMAFSQSEGFFFTFSVGFKNYPEAKEVFVIRRFNFNFWVRMVKRTAVKLWYEKNEFHIESSVKKLHTSGSEVYKKQCKKSSWVLELMHKNYLDHACS